MPVIVAMAVGVAPIVFAFVAGFFGATISLGWPVYIGWLVVCLIAGVVIALVRR